MDYTSLSLGQVATSLEDVAREADAVFGGFDVPRLNWRPDATRWSVGQCFDHLLVENRQVIGAARDALAGTNPPTLWQRVPMLPRLVGRLLIRTQSPDGRRRFKAPASGRPATSDIAGDIVARFVRQQREMADWVRTLDAAQAARVIVASPFANVVTYSVLDSCRLIAAHDWRHLQQARRVTQSPGFPGGGSVGVSGADGGSNR